jgi:hypothetical protein
MHELSKYGKLHQLERRDPPHRLDAAADVWVDEAFFGIFVGMPWYVGREDGGRWEVGEGGWSGRWRVAEESGGEDEGEREGVEGEEGEEGEEREEGGGRSKRNRCLRIGRQHPRPYRKRGRRRGRRKKIRRRGRREIKEELMP